MVTKSTRRYKRVSEYKRIQIITNPNPNRPPTNLSKSFTFHESNG
jgi:hypothetical protein